jgi:hypothetical protein
VKDKSDPAEVRKFVIALKRGQRDVPKDWVARFQRAEGVSVHEPTRPNRILVSGSRAAVKSACRPLSDFLYFEELIPHELA